METIFTYGCIQIAAPIFRKCGIVGKDLHKPHKPELPEALGLIAGLVLCCFLPKNHIRWCTIMGLWIGVFDDFLDLKWRYKLIMSAIAYIPLYQTTTTVLIFKYLIELGPFYHVYMLLWCIWCGNSINIHAGINGLEVGQCLIIGLGLMLFVPETKIVFSYVCVCLGLLMYNWYPAKVFVGDSWCYMSGMFFVAVAQHETEALAIIMLPQIVNTLLSLPELLGECPRHRMPTYDIQSDKLIPSGKGTFMNIILTYYGPMHERTLCVVLMILQLVCVCIAYMLR